MAPHVAEGITGVPAGAIEHAARTLWESRPVAFYTWSGLEQHSGTTQIIRAINQLYALTGSLDAPGGNVAFPSVPDQRDRRRRAAGRGAAGEGARGSTQRPLGPARFEFVTGEDVCTAALDGDPYRVRGLVELRREPRDGARRQRARRATRWRRSTSSCTPTSS